MMPAAGWVMLGSAATSAACCLAPRARATAQARANAVAMLTVMVIAATVPNLFLRAGSLILLTLAVGMGLGLLDPGFTHRRAEHARAVEGHRAAGSALTAAALLLHQPAGVASHGHAGQAVTAPGAVPIVLQAATVAYVAWTLVAVVRSRPSMTPLLRSEHLAMAACLAAMVLAPDHLAV